MEGCDMTYDEAIIEQTIAIQRKSDALLGKDKMNYEAFCEAVDEVSPPEFKDKNKAIGKYIKDTTGIPYYEIYLSIKFNKPLK